MNTTETLSAETRALRILEKNSQISDLYLKLTETFENNLGLVNFLLFTLLTGLLDPSRRLGMIFILCQLTDDPDFSEPVSHFWAFCPSEIERLMLYELVVEKNFSDFLSLSLNQLSTQLLTLQAKRKLTPQVLEERLKEVLAPGESALPILPICLVDPHAYDAESNCTLFEHFNPVSDLSQRHQSFEPVVKPLNPSMLLPIPLEVNVVINEMIPVPLAIFGPVLDPCMNNKMYINASIQNLGQINPEEQVKLQELIANFPELLEEAVLLERAEKLVNEQPEFTLGLLKTLRKSRKALFEK